MKPMDCPKCGAQIIEQDDGSYCCPYCDARYSKEKPVERENVFVTQKVIVNQPAPIRNPIVDKFFEHRQTIRAIKAEEKISKAEQKALESEQRKLEAEARREAAREERLKEAESRKKAWGCAAIVMSPILIPLGILLVVALVLAYKAILN